LTIHKVEDNILLLSIHNQTHV